MEALKNIQKFVVWGSLKYKQWLPNMLWERGIPEPHVLNTYVKTLYFQKEKYVKIFNGNIYIKIEIKRIPTHAVLGTRNWGPGPLSYVKMF